MIPTHTIEELNKLIQASNNATNELSERKIEDAVVVFKNIKDFHDSLSDALSELSDVMKKLRQEIMPAIFSESGVSSISIDGYRYTISHTTRASIPADTKLEAYDWLRNNELGALIIETVNASTLSAQAKKMMEDGEELPDSLFKVYLQPGVSVTKV